MDKFVLARGSTNRFAKENVESLCVCKNREKLLQGAFL